jgi:hypothetical protein
LYPVDPVALNIPDYPTIITDPMDMSTVETRLRNMEYTSPAQFALDMRKIWANSFRYNAKNSEIYQMTSEMSEQFEKMYRELMNRHQTAPVQNYMAPDNHVVELQKKIQRLQREVSVLNKAAPHRIVPKSSNHSKRYWSTEYAEGPLRDMSAQEKKILGQNIRSLPPEYLKGVWEIVSSGLPAGLQNKEEIEFDIDTLAPGKLRELDRYVKTKMAALSKQRRKQAAAQGQPSGNRNQMVPETFSTQSGLGLLEAKSVIEHSKVVRHR